MLIKKILLTYSSQTMIFATRLCFFINLTYQNFKMTEISVKIKSFELITEKLLEWYGSMNKGAMNDFSKLKLFKLLFFVSTVDASVENDGLLGLFDNFCAMPYGPVESDIYNNFEKCKKVIITKECTSINLNLGDEYYSEIEEYKGLIEKSIQSLKKSNLEIINYSAYDLVELSHQWISWKMIFSLAKKQDKSSLPIPTSILKMEPKILKMSINEFV